jgi:multimeric flavodoxin WrbA
MIPAFPDPPSGHRSFLFLMASARREGNTERLARAAANALPTHAGQRWIRLSDVPLPAFRDIRHSAASYPAPEGHERTLADATLLATDLVIVAPLYWYTVPASAKLYLDHWSGWMRVPGLEFAGRMAGKRLWAVIVHSGDDEAATGPLLGTLKLSAEYLEMDWRGALIGHGSRPGDIDRDADALARALTFFQPACNAARDTAARGAGTSGVD